MSEPLTRFTWERQFTSSSGLPPSTRHVGLMLAIFADADGTHVFPGTERLMEGTGLARSTVLAAMRCLRESGWIVRTLQSPGTGKADEYRLAIGTAHQVGPGVGPTHEARFESHPSSGSGSGSFQVRESDLPRPGVGPHQTMTNHPPDQHKFHDPSDLTHPATARPGNAWDRARLQLEASDPHDE